MKGLIFLLKKFLGVFLTAIIIASPYTFATSNNTPSTKSVTINNVKCFITLNCDKEKCDVKISTSQKIKIIKFNLLEYDKKTASGESSSEYNRQVIYSNMTEGTLKCQKDKEIDKVVCTVDFTINGKNQRVTVETKPQ